MDNGYLPIGKVMSEIDLLEQGPINPPQAPQTTPQAPQAPDPKKAREEQLIAEFTALRAETAATRQAMAQISSELNGIKAFVERILREIEKKG